MTNASGETPLIIASKGGHLGIVKYLAEKLKADVNERRTIIPKQANLMIHQGTALHAAIISGHVQVVDYLIRQCKADVNAITRIEELTSPFIKLKGFTPLHLAVKYLHGWMQHEIVCCLFTHGADWKLNDNNGRQCWEYTDDIEVTKLLIAYGIGLNDTRNKSSSNMLHKWVQSMDDRAIEVINYAIAKGADLFQRDRNGLTPLMMTATAGIGRNQLIFNLILTQYHQSFSRLDKIVGFELLGATCILRDIRIKIGLGYWETAMKLRFNVTNEPHIPKLPLILSDEFTAIFQVASEVQTLEELKNLDINFIDRLKMQAIMVYLRILGIKNIITQSVLTQYFLSIWDMEDRLQFLNFSKFMLGFCVATPFHNYPFSFLISRSIGLICSTPRTEILECDYTIVSYAMPIFRKLNSALKKTSDEYQYLNDSFLRFTLALTYKMMEYIKLNPKDLLELKSCLYEIISLNKRDSNGHDLLLLACSFHYFYDHCSNVDESIYSLKFRKGVSDKAIKLLLESGAHPDSINKNGDTGLHILAKNNHSVSSIAMNTLFEAGTHIDQVNVFGKTMFDIISQRRYKRWVDKSNAITFPLLKCLSARIIRRSALPLYGHLPIELKEFVQHH